MKTIEWNTSDKVQMAENITGTTSSTTYTFGNSSYQAEKGWECPRCGRINAPWVRQCDCSRNNWTITCNDNTKPEWWKEVTCNPDTFKIHPDTTIWKTPSSICQSHPDALAYTSDSTKGDPNTYVVGGSDFWDDDTHTWVNVPSISTNTVTDGKFHDDTGVPYTFTIKGE